jgi:hypothetical protein
MHAPLNGVSTTPILLILACCQARSILISSPNTLAPFVVSFVDYYWFISPPLPSPPHSCIILLRISQFDHFSAFPLKSEDTQWYPMHMKHNGASKTLLLLIYGVFPISDLIQCKLLCQRQQSGRTHPRSHPRPPRCHRTFPCVRWWDW